MSRLPASSRSVRSWGHAKIKIPSRTVGEKLTRYVFTELTDPNCTTLERYLLSLLLIRFLLFGALLICLFSVLFCSVLPLRLLSFGALLGTCKNQNPISVSRREINAILFHRIDRPELHNFGTLIFAVAPHPLPLVWCAPHLPAFAPGPYHYTPHCSGLCFALWWGSLPFWASQPGWHEVTQSTKLLAYEACPTGPIPSQRYSRVVPPMRWGDGLCVSHKHLMHRKQQHQQALNSNRCLSNAAH